MTYEYVCYTCGIPSAEPTCESCETHYREIDLDEPLATLADELEF